MHAGKCGNSCLFSHVQNLIEKTLVLSRRHGNTNTTSLPGNMFKDFQGKRLEVKTQRRNQSLTCVTSSPVGAQDLRFDVFQSESWSRDCRSWSLRVRVPPPLCLSSGAWQPTNTTPRMRTDSLPLRFTRGRGGVCGGVFLLLTTLQSEGGPCQTASDRLGLSAAGAGL